MRNRTFALIQDPPMKNRTAGIVRWSLVLRRRARRPQQEDQTSVEIPRTNYWHLLQREPSDPTSRAARSGAQRVPASSPHRAGIGRSALAASPLPGARRGATSVSSASFPRAEPVLDRSRLRRWNRRQCSRRSSTSSFASRVFAGEEHPRLRSRESGQSYRRRRGHLASG